MTRTYDISEVASLEDVPCIEREAEQAKLYLQTYCPEAGTNLYDHISEVLSKILLERPQNVFDSFEEYNKKVRFDKFKALDSNQLCDVYVPPPPHKNARKLIKLFKVIPPVAEAAESIEESTESVFEVKAEIPNMLDMLYFFVEADIGLPRADIVILNLSIRKFISDTNHTDVRFWGKILGRPHNYYVLEVTLSAAELQERLEILRGAEEVSKSESEQTDMKDSDIKDPELQALDSAIPIKSYGGEGEDEEESLQIEYPPVPLNTWTPPPEVTAEEIGTGANAKIYYVCNSPGFDNWVELPSVTPQQIVVARQTLHIFTGDLDSPIHTFPPFPGNEKNYLRAQIARIGAATHVSPIGYFKFGKDIEEDDGEEEEEEDIDPDDEDQEQEDEGNREIVKNPMYDPLPLVDLIDPSMSSWCHHSPYILKQGRVVFQDPTKDDNEVEDDGEGEGEDEEEEDDKIKSNDEEENSVKGNEYEREIGPPLLTPLSMDLKTPFSTPWTARQSSNVQPDTAVALIRSNIWPGAYAAAKDKKFFNVYVGWGCKNNTYNYSPPPMPEIQEQYVIDSELVEIQDPSFEEEEAYRIAHLPVVIEPEGEEEFMRTEDDSIDNP